ncbi:MAG: TM0106 family RecB-like putative nuclease [Chloroflexi bacterium]|nr:MAG: TM0106 family RecB-like putative nuclease [Chloroflexota bacterium]
MQYLEGRLVVSPSDLTGFLECEHLTQQELAAARGELARPDRLDPELEILRRRGLEHETRHLNSLRDLGKRVVEIPFPADRLAALESAHEATVTAMRQGADVIYQGTFFDGRWRCHADFLLRVDQPSGLGRYRYEVADAKLAKKAKAAAVLQCCVYTEQVAAIQGIEPDHITLILGDRSEEELRFRDYAAYYRSVKRRFEETVLGPATATYPDPVSHCDICRWIEPCDRRRRDDDHLCLVAGMRRDQTRRLQTSGIATVADLGASAMGQPIAGITDLALERLRQQARLQVGRRQTGSLAYEVLPPLGEQLGFQTLPPPSPADLFFDMEGDPFVGDDGLYYLFGVAESAGGRFQYHAFWGHDETAERRAFEQTVDLIIDRLDRSPDLHVYHYAPYEPNALKELAGGYATREAEVDRLLRGRVLVDLYRVVRQGVRMSTESYSLKSLEPFYRHERAGEIIDAAASIVAYEDWLQTGQPGRLEAIARYNEDDCLSTAQLRDWLEARRMEAIARYGDIPRPAPEDRAPSQTQRDVDERTAGLVERLLAGVPEEETDRTPLQQAAHLLAHSLNWHRREEKSEWWEYFRLCSLTDEQLIEEREAIGGLAFSGEVRQERQSNVFRYHFDAGQEYKIGIGDKPEDPRRQRGAGTEPWSQRRGASSDLADSLQPDSHQGAARLTPAPWPVDRGERVRRRGRASGGARPPVPATAAILRHVPGIAAGSAWRARQGRRPAACALARSLLPRHPGSSWLGQDDRGRRAGPGAGAAGQAGGDNSQQPQGDRQPAGQGRRGGASHRPGAAGPAEGRSTRTLRLPRRELRGHRVRGGGCARRGGSRGGGRHPVALCPGRDAGASGRPGGG